MDEVVRDMLSLGSISVAELTESRIHIQDLVVRLACERATRADLDALAANIERTERDDGRRPLPRAGRVLARVLPAARAAAHNQVLAMMVHSITEILMQFVYGASRRRQAAAEAGREAPRLPATPCASATPRRRRG